MLKLKVRQIALAAFLSLLLALFIFPLAVTAIGALMDEREVAGYINPLMREGINEGWLSVGLVPDKVTLKQFYILLIEQYKYINMFWNSVKYAVFITVGEVLVASMAAFVFAKINFRGRDTIFFIYIVAMMMPFQVTMVPNYITLKTIHLLYTDYAVILPGIFAPFGVFLLRQYMKTIPDELIEASVIDGAGLPGVFCRVILPLSKPGLAALAILTFIDNWNMVEQPLIFLDNELMYPLSLSLNDIVSQATNVAFAGSLIYMLPMVIIYFYYQESLISGIQLGQIKI